MDLECCLHLCLLSGCISAHSNFMWSECVVSFLIFVLYLKWLVENPSKKNDEIGKRYHHNCLDLTSFVFHYCYAYNYI